MADVLLTVESKIVGTECCMWVRGLYAVV